MPTDDVPQVIEGPFVVIVERDPQLLECLEGHCRERAKGRQQIFLVERLARDTLVGLFADPGHAHIPQRRGMNEISHEQTAMLWLVRSLREPSHGRVRQAHPADRAGGALTVRQTCSLRPGKLRARRQHVDKKLTSLSDSLRPVADKLASHVEHLHAAPAEVCLGQGREEERRDDRNAVLLEELLGVAYLVRVDRLVKLFPAGQEPADHAERILVVAPDLTEQVAVGSRSLGRIRGLRVLAQLGQEGGDDLIGGYVSAIGQGAEHVVRQQCVGHELPLNEFANLSLVTSDRCSSAGPRAAGRGGVAEGVDRGVS
jgi:hypothetical protein